MSNTELIIGGLKLMVLGMGWVFVFLVVMIIAMGILRRVIAPYASLLEPAPKAPAKPKASSNDDVQLAAIAAAAVEMAKNK